MAARQRRGKSHEAQDIVPPSRSRVSRRRKRETLKIAPARRKSSGVAPGEPERRASVRDSAPTWIDALAREHGGGARRYLVVELGGHRRVLISFATRELAEIYAEDEARWGTSCTVVDLDIDSDTANAETAKKRTG